MSGTSVGTQSRALVIIFGLLCLLLQSEEAHGTEYVVGDDKDWDMYPEIYDWGKIYSLIIIYSSKENFN
ncbi:hypothetical protein ACE6H2_016892 [Prunus campanulata]